MIACLPDSRIRVAVGSAARMDVRDDFLARAFDALPTGVDVFQKAKVFRRMQRGDRTQPRVVWRDEAAFRLGRAFVQDFDPARLLRVGLDRTVGHKVLGIVAPLPFIKDRFHSLPLRAVQPASSNIILVCSSLGRNPRRS